MGRRRWSTVVVTGVVLAVLWGAATPAYAHNALTGSDPDDGATVATGPDEVELEFLATLDRDRAELSVTGPDGASALAGEPRFDGSEVTVPVATELAGEYVLTYEVVSTDGHLVDGTVAFSVTEGAAATPAPATPAPATPGPATPGPTTAPPADPTPVGEEPVADAQGTGSGGGPLPWWAWLLAAVAVAAAAAGGGHVWWRRRAA